jgi:ATP-dependent Clp protease ATP-binding subunit ClpA
MFERYTDKARRSIFFARYEASNFGSQQIGTEHLLLGLVREDGLLLGSTAPLDSIRKWIEANAGPTGEKIPTSVDLPLSAECKRALSSGAEEATNLGHGHIAPGHLLLGLMDQQGCMAEAVLREHGYRADTFREVVASSRGESAPQEGTGGVVGATTRPSGAVRAHWDAMMALFSPTNAKARQIYFLAQGEARKMGSPCLETKHLLLALIQSKNAEGKDEEGPFFGVSRAFLRERIKPEPTRRERVSGWTCPPTDQLRNALGYAIEEANLLGHKEVGAEHLVLGLLREEASEASEILRASGLSLDQVRRAVAALRNQGSESEGSSYV